MLVVGPEKTNPEEEIMILLDYIENTINTVDIVVGIELWAIADSMFENVLHNDGDYYVIGLKLSDFGYFDYSTIYNLPLKAQVGRCTTVVSNVDELERVEKYDWMPNYHLIERILCPEKLLAK